MAVKWLIELRGRYENLTTLNCSLSARNRYVVGRMDNITQVMANDQVIHSHGMRIFYNDHFLDHLIPTIEECTLFHLEFGVEYPLLSYLRRGPV